MIMRPSAHERYRRELARLETRRPLVAVLDASCPGGQRPWVETFARFSPDREPWAEFVYERPARPAAVLRVRVYTDRTRAHSPAGKSVPGIGWLSVTPAAMDDRLPGLRPLLSLPDALVLRYRPGKRCTVRCRASSDGGDERIIAKAFPDSRGAQVHSEGRALFEASRERQLGFRVARPVRWQEETQTLWQELLPGSPVSDRLRSAEGPALALSMGEAAGNITTLDVPATNVLDADAQLERTVRAARHIASHIPVLEPRLAAMLDQLRSLHRRRADTTPRPVHGAPHAGQWLAGPDRALGLVDFDRFCLADPELDCATFLGELDFETMPADRRAAVAKAFIAGYERTAGRLDPVLLEAYRIHKHVSRVLRVARAVRTDGALRAGTILDEARARLDGVVP